jgi:hypothetical protein
MAKANDTSVAAEDNKLVTVRLLKGYVPVNAGFDVPREEPETKIYHAVPAGEVVDLPRDEARRAIQLGIAIVDADLI